MLNESQKAYYDATLSKLVPGDILDGTIIGVENTVAYVDVGYGISFILPLARSSIAFVPNIAARFYVGQQIRVVIYKIDEYGRFILSHKELLGTWQEEVDSLYGDSVGAVLRTGTVRKIDDFGIFVELSPNLQAVTKDKGPEWVNVGDKVECFVVSTNKRRLKVKVYINRKAEKEGFESGINYTPQTDYVYKYNNGEHIDKWVYSPEDCDKTVVTYFSEAEVGSA